MAVKPKVGNATPAQASSGGSAASAGVGAIGWVVRLALVAMIVRSAYEIRLFAIKSYGLVIHEFDPWFNFRATKYLADNGWTAFFHWFDHESWYPLGRPVGTTIYPGMQITAVCLWKLINFVGYDMSLNDVCCYMPAWFGAVASVFLGLLAAECTNSNNAGVAAAAIMAIIPAHIMRSVGGGFDNESVAMTAMCATFYFWNRSLRGPWSKPYAVIAGLAYVYMVAAWGGYVFVINMVGIHAAVLVPLGYFNDLTYWAYTIFFVIGTSGATTVPVVGLTPLKSLEQIAPLLVFCGYQALHLADIITAKRGKKGFVEVWKTRIGVGAASLLALLAVAVVLWPTGYFGPLSSRVRGLFVKHTRTGNPLVDSVAEHQPANEQAYKTYLHVCKDIAPFGLLLVCLFPRAQARFLVLYAAVAYYFANRMMRLIILIGPITSMLVGALVGLSFDWAFEQFFPSPTSDAAADESDSEPAAASTSSTPSKKIKHKPKSVKSSGSSSSAGMADPLKPLRQQGNQAKKALLGLYRSPGVVQLRKAAAGVVLGVLLYVAKNQGTEFWAYSHQLAEQLSSPSIMFHATLRDGRHVTVDDYREAYWWLRDNTPADSRVMAWWDYGYQIAGIANRTTIADGNTWNHEHIATLGRCLTSPEKEAHRIVRHLADFVLVWTGGGGDDLAKSPHMARIGNSVFQDICPGDPTCSQFGFYQGGVPTPMMEQSLLYKLHSNGMRPGVTVDPDRFREVYRSRFNKVRIYQVLKVSQESKRWVADPANRICDAPGSWYCEGQYPPALHKLIAKRKNFAQLEDFNRGGGDQQYTQEYMDRMSGKKAPPRGAQGSAPASTPKKKRKKKGSADAPPPPPKQATVDPTTVPWENTEATTAMWQLIANNDQANLQAWLTQDPNAAHMRSADGRGPLFWANEQGNKDVIDFLRSIGVRNDLKDAEGKLPRELRPSA